MPPQHLLHRAMKKTMKAKIDELTKNIKDADANVATASTEESGLVRAASRT